jgi:hypothetical protein
MFRISPITSVLIASSVVLAAPDADAKGTRDGETPAVEDVCDPLIGLTPGLFGLCLAFCEAQDCEATLDEATGETVFDPICEQSSPKILDDYNRLRTPTDPVLPCLTVVAAECPCWNEEELDTIADGETQACGLRSDGAFRLIGFDAATGRNESAIANPSQNRCRYTSQTPAVARQLDVTKGEVAACVVSIKAECAERGF